MSVATIKQYRRRLGSPWHQWPFISQIGPTELELLKAYRGEYVVWRPEYPHDECVISFAELELIDGRKWSILSGFERVETRGG